MLPENIRRHPSVRSILAAVGVAVAVAIGGSAFWLFGTSPSQRPTAAAPPTRSPTATPKQQFGPPRHVSIPAIGVDANVVPIQLSPQGVLEPDRSRVVGWYKGSKADFRYPVVNPGNSGSAVLTGHVDSDSGPAVFYKLKELSEGDEITVRDVNGEAATFTVTGRSQFPKSAFPEDEVWSGTDEPTLRVITCGGTFNEATQHYEDNILVNARLK